MTLPLTTTRVRVTRPPTGVDPYDPPPPTDYELIGEEDGVISQSVGSAMQRGGDASTNQGGLHLNPGLVLMPADLVEDLTTGEVWKVVWVRRRYELGVEYTRAGLEKTEGASDG